MKIGVTEEIMIVSMQALKKAALCPRCGTTRQKRLYPDFALDFVQAGWYCPFCEKDDILPDKISGKAAAFLLCFTDAVRERKEIIN